MNIFTTIKWTFNFKKKTIQSAKLIFYIPIIMSNILIIDDKETKIITAGI